MFFFLVFFGHLFGLPWLLCPQLGHGAIGRVNPSVPALMGTEDDINKDVNSNCNEKNSDIASEKKAGGT